MNSIYECDDVVESLEVKNTEQQMIQIISMLKENQQDNDRFIHLMDRINDNINAEDKATIGKALYKLFSYHNRSSLKIAAKLCFGLQSNISFLITYITKRAVIEKSEYQITMHLNLDNLQIDASGKFNYSTDSVNPDLSKKELLKTQIIDPEESKEEDADIGEYVEQRIGELEHSYFEWHRNDIEFKSDL